MRTMTSIVPVSDTEIQSRIQTIRGVLVMLDRDLAALYGVDVKRLNEQVNRNIERFSERFMHHAADVAQFNKQYANSLTVKLTDKFHDRYLIIDNATLIHVGASLNYLGKRCFAFSTLDAEFIPDIMARVP